LDPRFPRPGHARRQGQLPRRHAGNDKGPVDGRRHVEIGDQVSDGVRANTPIVLIMFGMFLGASIGFVDGLMGLQAWLMLGQPDFFIRPGHGEIHVSLLTFAGIVAGILYGGILVGISWRYSQKLRLARIYCASMIPAIPIFFCTDYYVIANRVPLTQISFLPEATVFFLSVMLAVGIGKDRRTMQGNSTIDGLGDMLNPVKEYGPAELDNGSTDEEQQS
ncbi:MAG: hypothetical protein ABFD90_13320, partial [Phycisphaerales bacterium]